MTQFGLEQIDLQEIISVIENFPEIQEARIYGSRALGNYKKASDIDIAIKGDNITYDVQSSMHHMLEEETMLPYFFDVTNYHSLSSEALKEHIDQHGIVFFTKQ
jgi:predicted nucleotidyltransferase